MIRLIPMLLPIMMCHFSGAQDLPGVILMMGDDHGWEETGYNDHPYLHTPVLDEMARSGLRFERFYAGHPNCSPTRASFLTGRHPNRMGTFTPNYSIRPEEITIAHLMSSAGYHCGHFGKWHVGAVKAGSPVNPGRMGFDEWLSHDNFFEMNPPLSRNGAPPEILIGEGSAVLVEESIAFIERAQAARKPFFVVIWFASPHEPYSGLPEDLAFYEGLPERYGTKTVQLTSNETGQQVSRLQGEVLRERYAEITAMDRAIGRLRDYLSDSGLRENTLLFYCGDNGTSSEGLLSSPHRGAKSEIYEGGTLVPGLLEWPALISAGRSSSFRASTSDLMPTLASLTQQSLPDRPIDGVDLMPLIKGAALQRDTPLFFWMFDPKAVNGEPYIDPGLQEGTTPLVKLMDGRATRNFVNYRRDQVSEGDFRGDRSIIHNHYKLVIRDAANDNELVELFDLGTDPAERQSIAAEYRDVVTDLKGKMRQWQESVMKSLMGHDYTAKGEE